MRRFLRELIPLLIILAVVSVLTLVPYFSNKSELKQEKQTNTYLCSFSSVMREFVNAAAEVRLATAQKGNPKLHAASIHAANVYEHVRNELKNLPPDINCNKLIGAK